MSGNLGQRDDVTGVDDLTRIGAIGPRRAARLNAAGIHTYAELASCSRDEIATVLPDVSPAKIDAWRDEARELTHAAPADAPAAQTRNGQSTRARTAEAHGAPAEAYRAPAEAHGPPAEAHGPPAEAQRARPASFAVLSVERTPLRAAEPFTLTLAIELAGPASHADRLAYSAVVVAMPLASGQRRTVAKSDGVLATTSSTISIDAAGLSPGAYRLEGAVSLRAPGADHAVNLAGIAEGLLVQVLPS